MMYRFYLAAIDLLPGAIILIPVYWILNRVHFHDVRKSAFYCIFSCYLAAVYVLVGMPTVTYVSPEFNLNLIPILGFIDDWKNSILNVLLFIPLGVMLPIGWMKYRINRNAVLFGFGMSLSIEILQIFTFRATDVNDLITNTLGTFFGFLLAGKLMERFPLAKEFVNEAKSKELAVVCSTTFAIMFFVHPFLSSALWDLVLS